MSLREVRQERKLTQEQLAALADVEQTTISQIECGVVSTPSWPTVYKLSQALGVPADELFPVEPRQAS